METKAQPRRDTRLKEFLSQPWTARMLATIGVIVTLVGFYTPFAGRDTILYAYPVSHYSETWTLQSEAVYSLTFLHRGHWSLLPALVIYALYTALTLGGLALIPLFWRPLSMTAATRVRGTYGAWLLLMALLAVAGLLMWHYFLSLASSLPQPVPESAGPLYIMPGAILYPFGLLVSGVAVPVLRWAPLPTPFPTPRTGWQWASALTLTAGALVWLIGFYLMPEATTTACPPITFSVTQFAHGACAGLDSDQVLQSAYYAGLNPVARLFYTLGRNFELLVALVGLTALGGWTRQLSVWTLAWLAIWPVMAFGVALVALQGVGELARHGFMLTAATTGSWHVAAGMIVTFAGIGLVALGQMGLWRAMVMQKRAA